MNLLNVKKISGLALLLAFFSIAAFAGSKDKKEISVNPGGTVQIELKYGGAITFIGWDKNIAEVEAEGDDDEDNIKIDLDYSGNTLRVKIKGDDGDYEESVDVTINIPRSFNLDFSTQGGAIKIENIEGKLDGSTMGGSIKLNDTSGEASLKTMGGAISLKDCDITGEVETMGGGISYTNSDNFVSKNSEVPELKTMGGGIKIENQPNGVKVKTMGGGIGVDKAKKIVEVETMGGGITISKADAKIVATTMGGSIYAEQICAPDADNRDIKLESMGGEVTLKVPENFDMDVEIELYYDKKHTDRVEIKSDFKLEQTIEDAHKAFGNKKGKVIKAYGKFGSGKNRVKIKTYNSDINLTK